MHIAIYGVLSKQLQFQVFKYLLLDHSIKSLNINNNKYNFMILLFSECHLNFRGEVSKYFQYNHGL